MVGSIVVGRGTARSWAGDTRGGARDTWRSQQAAEAPQVEADPSGVIGTRTMGEGRITILALDAIGDLTLRQPMLAGLVAAGFDVTVVVRQYVASLLPHLHTELVPIVSTISAWEELAVDDARDRLAALAKAIRQSAPDVIVVSAYSRTWLDEWALALVPGARRVGLVDRAKAPAAGAHVPYGLDVAPRPLDVEVPCSELDHESVKNASLLRALTGHDPEHCPVLHLTDEGRATGRAILHAHGLVAGQYLIGCPAGAVNHNLKAWPIESYATLLVATFRDFGLPTLLVGAESERPALQSVVARAGGTSVLWCGGRDDLGRLVALIATSRLYLGADSGPMHLAGALGVPVVANVGGGHWPRFLPLARPAFVGTQKLPCFGCGWTCRLGQPRCLATGTEPFHAGIRWILAGGAEGLRVDPGVALDNETSAAIQQLGDGAVPRTVIQRLDAALGRSSD